MSEPIRPAPTARSLAVPLVVSAAAAFAFVAAAVPQWAVGSYEPAVAAVAGLAALALIVLPASWGRGPANWEPRFCARALAACGLGAALGAGAYPLAHAVAPQFLKSGCAVIPRGRVTKVHCHGRQVSYPDAERARGDALVACGQARSLARVLLLGGGRPELVRELLARGAVEIDAVDPDAVLDEALAPCLTEEDRAAAASPRVRRYQADPMAFLSAHRGAPYDLAVLSPPEPGNILFGRWYARELHQVLAPRLGPQGVAVVSLPDSVGGEFGLPPARIFEALQEAYPEKAVAALPGKPCRLLAARRQGVIKLDAEAAAVRCSQRLLPGGGQAPPVEAAEMRKLIDRDGAKELTMALDGTTAPESLRSPRLFLEHRAWERPAGSALLRWVLAVPLWACLPVLLVALAGGMLIARRGAGPEGPGRFALGAAAFTTGAVLSGTCLTLALLYQALQGALGRQLPVFAALAAAGLGLGGAVAARLADRARRAPRMSLAALGFGWLLLQLLAVALANLIGSGPAAGPAVGAAAAALSFAAGLELGVLMSLWQEGTDRAGPFASIAVPGLLGAAAGAGLVAVGLLPAFGPPAALLMLLGLKLVELGVVAAGAGRAAGTSSSG